MHTVVVGGGIVGAAVAARLGSAGREVTLLERGEIGAETTAASAGLLMRSAIEPDPFDLRFRDRAYEAYRDLFAERDLEAPQRGILRVAETPAFATRLERSAAALREHGVAASVLDSDELAAFGIEPDGFEGALYTDGDRVCDPAAVARAFADRAREASVDVRPGVEVTDIETRNGRVVTVETDAGQLEADYVVNATGPWAPALDELVGIDLPLRHTRGPMLALGCAEPPAGPTAIFESKRYVRPTETGAWIGAYRTEYADGRRRRPDKLRERSVSATFRESVAELERAVPALRGATIVDEWVGFRTVTPDGRPLVGEVGIEGYLVAVGMTGQGITLAPAVADVVGKVLEDDLDAELRRRLAPDRFDGTSTRGT
jgi:sarcosine oxidase, subunit beta